MADDRDKHRLMAAVQQLRSRYPHADPAMLLRAAIDARGGLSTFGFRPEEQSATLIAEIAGTDPRLRPESLEFIPPAWDG